MNLQDILYAVEVAHTGNFSKAAENLYITEPTISQRIRKLEQELDVTLFVRTTRKVTLTPEGEVFLRKAVPVIEHYDALRSSMRQLSRESRKCLSVGMTTRMYGARLPQFFREYCLSHSDIDVRIHTATYVQLRESLRRGTIDFAVLKLQADMVQFFDPDVFRQVLLRREKVYALMAARLVPPGKTQLEIRDIAHLPVIIDNVGSSMYRMVETTYRAAGFPLPLSPIHSNDEEIMLLAAENGDGVVFASASTAAYYQSRYQFCALPLVPTIENNIYLVYHQNMQLTSYDRELIQALRQWMKRTGSEPDTPGSI